MKRDYATVGDWIRELSKYPDDTPVMGLTKKGAISLKGAIQGNCLDFCLDNVLIWFAEEDQLCGQISEEDDTGRINFREKGNKISF